MAIPQEYEGREQTYLKHRVLTEYLVGWAHKRGSGGRYGPIRLWYVDCFAGPWKTEAHDLNDTSVAIGLQALRDAAETWRAKAGRIELSAIFVEKNPRSYQRLVEYLEKNRGDVRVEALNCEFGDAVSKIDQLVGQDPAFLFVDPTGWKGAAMNYIAPLAAKHGRDVLINVMFDHIQRFKAHPQEKLRQQMREFFGLTDSDVPATLTEEELFALYGSNVREKCRVEYVADLAIRHPSKDRTYFRLVVGGHHPAVIELFRNIERKVCGLEAGAVAEEVRKRGEAQGSLFEQVPDVDDRYAQLRDEGMDAAPGDVAALLESAGPRPYAEVWAHVLQRRHITRKDLNEVLVELRQSGEVEIMGMRPRQRVPDDDNVIGIAETKVGA
ncbi:MAG: three-Cys-motif partner protein TcmP [Dehalococcoidales bacterium]|nr:three-Cys-motif partner protein TcmP [Dehalococcoidales bacterium]